VQRGVAEIPLAALSKVIDGAFQEIQAVGDHRLLDVGHRGPLLSNAGTCCIVAQGLELDEARHAARSGYRAVSNNGATSTEQMWCLTLATNALVTWITEYHGLAVAALLQAGRYIDDAVLAHSWPTHHESVNFYDTHSVDVDGELAKLDADGYRPLRAAATGQAR
jgi:hypothetical protein